jgi:hypothetical protein
VAEISVVIASYNTRDVLRVALTALRNSIGSLDVEVIVVDNGSIDSTPTMIKSEFPEIKLMSNAVNRYFTAANNQGLREAKGEYVVIMNSDVIVLPSTLGLMKSFMDSHPAVGAASCIFVNPDMSVRLSCWRLRSPLLELLTSGLAGRVLPFLSRKVLNAYEYGEWDRRSTREVDVLSDAFIMIRSEAGEAIDFYDEGFCLYYTEDDLCHRLLAAGWKNCHVADARVIHILGESTKRLDPSLVRAIKTNDRVKYYSKYYGLVVGLLIRIFAGLADALATILEH